MTADGTHVRMGDGKPSFILFSLYLYTTGTIILLINRQYQTNMANLTILRILICRHHRLMKTNKNMVVHDP